MSRIFTAASRGLDNEMRVFCFRVATGEPPVIDTRVNVLKPMRRMTAWGERVGGKWPCRECNWAFHRAGTAIQR